jgi:hypothetical protein
MCPDRQFVVQLSPLLWMTASAEEEVNTKEVYTMRTVFAMAVGVDLITCTVPWTLEAAPIARLPSVTTNNNVTQT